MISFFLREELMILPVEETYFSHPPSRYHNFSNMKKSIFSLLIALLGFGGLTTSCEDMLTPDLERYTTEFSGKDTVNFYLGIVANLQDVVEQNVLLGELRGDLVTPTEYATDSISDIINFRNLADGESLLLNRAAYYKVINQCNFYLDRADSMVMKNNSYLMRRELAQVQLVRAWTYMQLVQNYGRVPFIVKPVNTSGTGWDTNPEDWATPDNLLNLLEEKGGLKQAYAYSQTYGYPNYGKFNTGSVAFQQKYLVFNADLVYGDLHLLRGQSQDDYVAAATYYHKYLDREVAKVALGNTARVSVSKVNGAEVYEGNSDRWLSDFSSNNYTNSSDVITVVPSAANTFFGKMLLRVPQVYGFDATSSYSTQAVQTEENGKKKDDAVSSGSVSIRANYRNRQVEPSIAMEKLALAQPFVYNRVDEGRVTEVKYLPIGDQRFNTSAPRVTTDEGRMRFIQKFTRTSTTTHELFPSTFGFRYGITLYRLRQVYLRYAEALNRAGYPRYAFAVLRDGLSLKSLPTTSVETKIDTVYTDETHTDIDKIIYSHGPSLLQATNGANYIGLPTLIRAENKPFLDFSRFEAESAGTREAGSSAHFFNSYSGTAGESYHGFTDMDSIWTYSAVVAQRMADEAARKGGSANVEELKKQLEGELNPEILVDETTSDAKKGNDTYVRVDRRFTVAPNAPSVEEINAVETLIADELALETAYEGFRYYDLMRLARHRNVATADGTEWMAWLISRRDLDLAPYAEPQRTGTLFPFLSNMENWYLPAPKH